MKKTLFLLLALCSVSLAPAKAAVFAESGNFTVTFKWDEALRDSSVTPGSGGTIVNIRFGFGNGKTENNEGKSSYLALGIENSPSPWDPGSDTNYSLSSIGTDLMSMMQPLDVDLTGSTIVLKVENLYDKSTRKGTYYVQLGDGSLQEIGSAVVGGDVMELGAITLTQDNATVTLGDNGNEVRLNSLQANDKGTIVTPGNLSILRVPKMGKNEVDNKVDNLEVNGVLTLGSAEKASTLVATGTLSATGGITLGNIASSASATTLLGDALNVSVSDSELLKLTGGSTTVLTLAEAYDGATTLNGVAGEYICGEKMVYTLVWENTDTVLNLYANSNSEYVQNKLAGTVRSRNGRAGLAILSNAFGAVNPQMNAPEGDLAGLMNTVDAGTMTDNALAATTGASVAVLGQAFSGDVERQLRAIRNRSVSGSVGSDSITLSTTAKGKTVGSATDKFSLWVNAEGNRSEQDADGTAAGYTLSSWGATLGAGMQVNSRLSLGLALTAMYGDLKSDGPDLLDGDMDTAYLSAFAQYQRGAWNHSFIATAGAMESDYRRTVSHATGSYSVDGDTEGTAVGLMYELSREYALTARSSISPVFNISYRHTKVDGYTERGSDAALSVDEQSLDTVTMGLGARYAATVGQRTINRSCGFEARALAKCDFGDRQSDTMVGFMGQAARANIESAELGAFGLELGAGISVPVGTGSIFADGAVELRSDYTNFNATVGYKIEF